MAHLINVFSGKTKTYSDNGITFKTAIKKSPVEGAVTIDYSGVVGNEIANHKNAIYAFNVESYDYWRNQSSLNVEWEAGLFGENLSLTGLSEQTLCIGDTLTMGDVILQVSGCRTPCGNLLWRLSAPDSFLSEFQSSGHSGIYLEVLRTGVVLPGDTIKHVKAKHNSISVADLALFFMEPNPDVSEIKRLIAIPGMGQQMLSMLTALLNEQREKELVFQDRWAGWKPLIIRSITDESSLIKSFYLSPKEPNSGVAGYKAGQYLTVKLNAQNGEELIRCWSISDYDEDLQQYRISIKREEQGNASKIMHDEFKVGDTLEVMAPNGAFTLQRNDIAVPVVLISAGVGITPMISMLKSHRKRLDKRLPTLHFIHSTQNAQTHAFKNEVQEIIAKEDNFHQHIIYTKPDSYSIEGEDFQQTQRLNEESLSHILSGMGCWFAEKWIDVAPFECQYYLCGPDAFIQDVKLLLKELDVPVEAIFEESFSGDNSFDFTEELKAAKVTFNEQALEVNWQPEKPMTLLELAESSGIRPQFSCRNGHCGLCSTELKSGEVKYLRTPAIEVHEGNVLLCCSVPKSDIKLTL